MKLRNVGILLQHHTTSQLRRLRLETSSSRSLKTRRIHHVPMTKLNCLTKKKKGARIIISCF
jgi:hypothetical protein